MPTREKIQEDSGFNSARISELSRYVGFGLLATYYAVKVSPNDAFPDSLPLLVVGLGGAFAVVLDYFHYVSGYLTARFAISRKQDYNEGWPAFFFGLKTLAFVGKQAAALAGSGALIALLICAA